MAGGSQETRLGGVGLFGLPPGYGEDFCGVFTSSNTPLVKESLVLRIMVRYLPNPLPLFDRIKAAAEP